MPLWNKSKSMEPIRQSMEMASPLDLRENILVRVAYIFMALTDTIGVAIIFSIWTNSVLAQLVKNVQ